MKTFRRKFCRAAKLSVLKAAKIEISVLFFKREGGELTLFGLEEGTASRFMRLKDVICTKNSRMNQAINRYTNRYKKTEERERERDYEKWKKRKRRWPSKWEGRGGAKRNTDWRPLLMFGDRSVDRSGAPEPPPSSSDEVRLDWWFCKLEHRLSKIVERERVFRERCGCPSIKTRWTAGSMAQYWKENKWSWMNLCY